MKNILDIQEFQQFDNIEFIARQIVEGFITGLHRSPFHGFSVEFAEHRLYNTGESTKHIDWKLYARTERLFVKRYEEETNLRAQVVIDTSSSMLFPYKDKRVQSKLAFSVFCGAALIYLLRRQRDAVGLTLFSNQVNLHTPCKLSSVHAKLIYAELSKLITQSNPPLKEQTSAAKCLHEIAENTHKRSLVILFSDMFDHESDEDLFAALQHLRYNKHEVILFHVTDHQREKEFNFPNRPHRFIDMETGESLKLNPNEIRQAYQKSAKEFFSAIKLKCGQYHIDLVEVDVNKDFREVLMPYLLKRHKMY